MGEGLKGMIDNRLLSLYDTGQCQLKQPIF